MHLLARHAENLFWLGRYIERTASLARILLVQSAFDRGRAQGTGWAWILALYDESALFGERYGEATAANVTRYYLSDPEHFGSIYCSMEAARTNARTLRALISTGLWTNINRTYARIKGLPAHATDENRLAATCEAIQHDCFALLGIAQATLYRDAGWRFFELGIEIERADQMSRLLDVRFAQLQTGSSDGTTRFGDFTHWSMLLRACGGHHAYRGLVAGPLQPENVARFLIFEQSFAASIAHCAVEVERSVNELRTVCGLRTPGVLLKDVADLHEMLHFAMGDAQLVEHLHGFNDAVQRQLAAITNQLGACYFGMGEEAPVPVSVSATPAEPNWAKPAPTATAAQPEPEGVQSQTQSQSQGQTLSQPQQS